MCKVYGYVRVSTVSQKTQRQIDNIKWYNANAIIRPSTNEAAVQKTNSFVVIAATVVSVVVTVVAARVVELSTAYHLTFMYFFRKFIKIRSSVF